jgi:hypothetical protein
MNENRFEPLDSEDVLQIPHRTFNTGSPRFMDLLSAFSESFRTALNDWSYNSLVMHETGFPISVLKTSGGGWQKGRLRIRVVFEFEPELPPIVEEQSHDH